jgi:hypothetical protein
MVKSDVYSESENDEDNKNMENDYKVESDLEEPSFVEFAEDGIKIEPFSMKSDMEEGYEWCTCFAIHWF